MKNKQDKIACLSKLERCCNTLNYFKCQIDSYLYEPTTKALFDTKEYLYKKIMALEEANQTLLEYLKLTKELLPDQYQLVNFHIQETFDLEFHVMEYTAISRKSN